MGDKKEKRERPSKVILKALRERLNDKMDEILDTKLELADVKIPKEDNK